MRPEQRDKVRWCSDAAIFAAESVGEGDAERLDIDRAIIAFCPPGDAKPPRGYTVVGGDRITLAIGDADNDDDEGGYVNASAEMTIADAERLAWALLAEVARVRSLTTKPADAGEETP